MRLRPPRFPWADAVVLKDDAGEKGWSGRVGLGRGKASAKHERLRLGEAMTVLGERSDMAILTRNKLPR